MTLGDILSESRNVRCGRNTNVRSNTLPLLESNIENIKMVVEELAQSSGNESDHFETKVSIKERPSVLAERLASHDKSLCADCYLTEECELGDHCANDLCFKDHQEDTERPKQPKPKTILKREKYLENTQNSSLSTRLPFISSALPRIGAGHKRNSPVAEYISCPFPCAYKTNGGWKSMVNGILLLYVSHIFY